MCMVLFGKMSKEQVEKLLDMYNSYKLYCDRTPKWNLSGFKRGSFKKSYLSRVLRFWLSDYVPSEALLEKIASSKDSAILYLESICKRILDWEDYEQEYVLKLSSTRIKMLTKQLSPKYEEKLLNEGTKTQIEEYVQNFVLSLAAERAFIRKLANNPMNTGVGYYLHFAAWRYIEAHPHKAFSKVDAQQLLFELPNCKDVQEQLIKQSTMLKPSLCDIAIEILIDDAATRKTDAAELLKLFLSVSYIENEALIEKFQKSNLSVHLKAMLDISQTRWNLLNTLS